MDDMVHRLREIGFELGADYYPIVFDAADEIERLRKQVEMTRSDQPTVADLYRKRPVIVEVMGPLTVDNAVQVQSWCGGTIGTGYGEPVALIIPTLEGSMVASLGDYVIRGVQGEFYPCKPDIFAQTYEPVEARRG